MRRLLSVFVVMAAIMAAMAVPAFAATSNSKDQASLEADTVSNFQKGGALGDTVSAQAKDPTMFGAPLGERVSTIAPLK